MTTHVVHVAKHKRDPFLDAVFEPICAHCGPIGGRTDLDTAKEATRRHISYIEASRLATEQARAPRISNNKENAHE